MSSNCIVHVVNIPYDHTEEQVLDVFKSVGPVAKFKLLFDEETGRSKGYAYVEYFDGETAASAVRNLNNYQMGSRTLKVRITHQSPFEDERRPDTDNSFAKHDGATMANLPTGRPLSTGMAAPGEITRIVESYTLSKQHSILSAMKKLANSNPSLTKELLETHPQLSYAVVQILLALGLVDVQGVSDMIVKNEESTGGRDITDGTAAGQDAGDDEQTALIRQVMQLTEDQIKSLPEEQKQALILLRQKVESGEIKI